MGGQRRAGSDRRGVQCLVRRRSSCMPLITAFNLRKEDRLPDIENALRRALVSMPELKINDDEIDFVPVSTPDGFHGQVTRINVDLWEGSHRTKAALQELAARAATAFQRVTGSDRKVKVVIRPYDVEGRGGSRVNQQRNRRNRNSGRRCQSFLERCSSSPVDVVMSEPMVSDAASLRSYSRS